MGFSPSGHLLPVTTWVPGVEGEPELGCGEPFRSERFAPGCCAWPPVYFPSTLVDPPSWALLAEVAGLDEGLERGGGGHGPGGHEHRHEDGRERAQPRNAEPGHEPALALVVDLGADPLKPFWRGRDRFRFRMQDTAQTLAVLVEGFGH